MGRFLPFLLRESGGNICKNRLVNFFFYWNQFVFLTCVSYFEQPCLGRDSKTLMFVNISPDSPSVGESLCSLRFAARVNACEIGVPSRQLTLKAADSRLSYG